MTKTIIYAALIISSMAILSTSCGKYEDGPGFSLRSKKARLTGEWEFDEYEGEGLLPGETFEWDIKKDGAIITRYSDGTYSETIAGEWEWKNNKKDIEITYRLDDGSTYREKYEILRLKNKELWLEDRENKETRFKQ